ncbi:MAG: M28 family peptidase [Bacteroidota bacterium]
MTQVRSLIVLFLLILVAIPGFAQLSPVLSAEDVLTHIRYLASEELQGRGSGTPGGEAAAAYIEAQFKQFGLSPAQPDGSFRQKFEFVSSVRLGSDNRLIVKRSGRKRGLTLHDDFRPMGFSGSGTYSGGVVVVGYGISLPMQGYDDYAGIDVAGKAVIVLRYSPHGDKPPMEFQASTALRTKVLKAKEKGALAVIVITGPADADTDVPMKLSYDRQSGTADLPVISVRRSVVDDWLRGSGLSVKSIQDSLLASKKPRSFALSEVELEVRTDVQLVRATSDNVVGLLEGSDPTLRNEIVVLGAHYDHLGMGGEDSGSLKPDTIAVHNGADDNASGTAGLLELAQYFATRSPRPKRSLLFVAFSGEELGLLGSSAYVNAPTTPVDRMTAMINMDMIGRLTDRKLIVYGIGTSPGFEMLITARNADSSFALKLNKDGYGPSDHSSFYGKKIPVFHFFTDLHSDYHRPSDDWQLINAGGEQKVLEFIAGVADDLANRAERPAYVQAEPPRPMGGGDGRSGSRTYTGTIPDFGEQTEGMKLAGVREGSPAAKAGLQAGDVIVKFGKVDIKNLYDYTYALGEYKPGDEVSVIVKRGSETLTFPLKLDRRN